MSLLCIPLIYSLTKLPLQLGSAIGVTVTTIIFNRVLAQDSRKLGVILDANLENAPKSAQLKAYQAAQWGGFCFCMIGRFSPSI